MKILKYLLFLVLGLLLIFLLLGLMKPAINYGHEITVDKPLKEVWAVHQDASKYNQWLEGFQSIELISGEQGKVGSKYKVVVNPGDGQDEFEMVETIRAINEFENISLSFDSEMMLFDQTTSFSEKGGKTTLKTDSTVKGKGIMMRSMFAAMELFGGAFQAQETKNIEALKTVIEKNSTDYFPAPVELRDTTAVPE